MLIDVTVALFMTGLVLVGCYSVLSTSSSAANTARQNVYACNAARQITENLRQYKAAPVSNGTYSDATVFGSVPALSQMSGASASVSVSTYRSSIHQAVITVQWRAGSNNMSKSLTSTTLLTSGGVSL